MGELGRPEKILIAMLELGSGTARMLDYEDIVVKSWKLFPEEFGLRKYVQDYPDSSDVHKPLYGPLKDRGLIRSGNKRFGLTERGITHALQAQALRLGKPVARKAANRLSRDEESEMRRINESEALRLFAAGNQEKILDTDFYSYLGASVRTERHSFLGKLKSVSEAIESALRIDNGPKTQMVADLHAFLLNKFGDIIKQRTSTK